MALALRHLRHFFFLCLIARYVLLLIKSFVIDKKHTQQAINNAVFQGFLKKPHLIRPVNEWCAIALACNYISQYLLGHAIFARAKLYMTS